MRNASPAMRRLERELNLHINAGAHAATPAGGTLGAPASPKQQQHEPDTVDAPAETSRSPPDSPAKSPKKPPKLPNAALGKSGSRGAPSPQLSEKVRLSVHERVTAHMEETYGEAGHSRRHALALPIGWVERGDFAINGPPPPPPLTARLPATQPLSARRNVAAPLSARRASPSPTPVRISSSSSSLKKPPALNPMGIASSKPCLLSPLSSRSQDSAKARGSPERQSATPQSPASKSVAQLSRAGKSATPQPPAGKSATPRSPAGKSATPRSLAGKSRKGGATAAPAAGAATNEEATSQAASPSASSDLYCMHERSPYITGHLVRIDGVYYHALGLKPEVEMEDRSLQEAVVDALEGARNGIEDGFRRGVDACIVAPLQACAAWHAKTASVAFWRQWHADVHLAIVDCLPCCHSAPQHGVHGESCASPPSRPADGGIISTRANVLARRSIAAISSAETVDREAPHIATASHAEGSLDPRPRAVCPEPTARFVTYASWPPRKRPFISYATK